MISKKGILGLVIVAGLLIGASLIIALPAKKTSVNNKKSMEMVLEHGVLDAISGEVEEEQTITQALNFGDVMVHKAKVTLTWEDDVQGSQPDQFKLELQVSNETRESVSGDTSPITVELDVSDKCKTEHTDTGDENKMSVKEEGCCGSPTVEGWGVYITLVDGGDKNLGPLGLLRIDDSGNSWTLNVEYDYCTCCKGSNEGGGAPSCH